jgi:multimeric flavodoxin WrbA
MNRILVLFDSKSGNVAKMAALVAEGAQRIADTEVRVCSVDEATADDVIWCDGLAVGSPTNMGILSWKMKRFWDEAMMPHWMDVDGKIACAFSSAGAWGGGWNSYRDIYGFTAGYGCIYLGIGRAPGWCTEILEQASNNILIRPLLRYTGPMDLEYTPIEAR